MEEKLLEKLAGDDSGSPCVDDQLLINDDICATDSEAEIFSQDCGTYEDFLNIERTDIDPSLSPLLSDAEKEWIMSTHNKFMNDLQDQANQQAMNALNQIISMSPTREAETNETQSPTNQDTASPDADNNSKQPPSPLDNLYNMQNQFFNQLTGQKKYRYSNKLPNISGAALNSLLPILNTSGSTKQYSGVISPNVAQQLSKLSQQQFSQLNAKSTSNNAVPTVVTDLLAQTSVPASTVSSLTNSTQLTKPDTTQDDAMNNSNTRKRFGVPYSKPITDLLTHWLLTHAHHPYPTEEEKLELCRQTQLSLNQLNNWFTNARRRNKILIAAHAQAKGGF